MTSDASKACDEGTRFDRVRACDRGLFAPVSATRDGGFLVIGNKIAADKAPPSGIPVVIRADTGGGVVWETSLRRSDFQDFEASSFVATPDGGVIAHVLSYKAEGAGAVNRLVKLDRAGAIVWDWVGCGHGDKDTPFARTLQLTRGRIYMTGHVYRAGSDIEYAWTGEVDAASGKLIKDEVGAIDPYRRKR